MLDVGVHGLDDVLKKLDKLPERIQKNVVVGAIRAATRPLVKEARLRVPKDSGKLAKSIGVIKRKEKDKNLVRFSVTPRKNKEHGYLAYFVEFGTSKQAAHPFMRPAAEAKVDETVKTAREYMAKRTDKEIAKL